MCELDKRLMSLSYTARRLCHAEKHQTPTSVELKVYDDDDDDECHATFGFSRRLFTRPVAQPQLAKFNHIQFNHGLL